MIRLVAVLLYVALESFVSLIYEGARAWLLVKPWKRFQAWRAKRSWRKEHGGKPDEILESFNNDDGEQVDKLAEVLGKLRTSTKGGAVGAFAPLVVALPFYDQINTLATQACQSENGPIVFLTGAAITWVSFYITARRSKTPANPGTL